MYVDDDFDKTKFIEDLKAMVRLLSETSTWPERADLGVKAFTQLIEDFRTSPIVELVDKARIADEASADQVHKLLNALGSLDLTQLGRTRSFLEAAEKIVTLAQNNVDRKYALSDQADPDRIANEIDDLLASFDVHPNPAIDGATS